MIGQHSPRSKLPLLRRSHQAFLATVQDANTRRTVQPQQAAAPLLAAGDPEIQRQYMDGAQTRHRDIFLNDNLSAQRNALSSRGTIRSAERETAQRNVSEEHPTRRSCWSGKNETPQGPQQLYDNDHGTKFQIQKTRLLRIQVIRDEREHSNSEDNRISEAGSLGT